MSYATVAEAVESRWWIYFNGFAKRKNVGHKLNIFRMKFHCANIKIFFSKQQRLNKNAPLLVPRKERKPPEKKNGRPMQSSCLVRAQTTASKSEFINSLSYLTAANGIRLTRVQARTREPNLHCKRNWNVSQYMCIDKITFIIKRVSISRRIALKICGAVHSPLP